MLRSLVVTTCAAATLAGCASARPDPGAPLDIRLAKRGSDLRVHLTRPAYVAIFEVRPGVAPSLVYPRAEGDPEWLGAGTTALGNPDLRPQVRPAAGFGGYYLYAVASRRPLEVAQFSPAEGSDAVRDVIGGNAESRDLEPMLEALEVAMMSPEAHASGDWTSHLLVPWEYVAPRMTALPAGVDRTETGADRMRNSDDRMVNCHGSLGATVRDACAGSASRRGGGGGGRGARIQPRDRSN